MIAKISSIIAPIDGVLHIIIVIYSPDFHKLEKIGHGHAHVIGNGRHVKKGVSSMHCRANSDTRQCLDAGMVMVVTVKALHVDIGAHKHKRTHSDKCQQHLSCWATI